jgi:Family of unknown function (DUF6166)
VFEQRFCLPQITRVEPFGEPAVDRSEKLARLLPLALIVMLVAARSSCDFACCSFAFFGSADGDTRALPIRHDLANHSQAFEWGYGGSGPAQLALALLADALENADYTARRYHQQFKDVCVARMPNGAWSMTANTVCDMTAKLRG